MLSLSTARVCLEENGNRGMKITPDKKNPMAAQTHAVRAVKAHSIDFLLFSNIQFK